MAEARSGQRWSHTAALLALIANCHRDPRRQRPFTLEDFLPRAPRAPAPPLTDLSILKTIFVDRPPEKPR